MDDVGPELLDKGDVLVLSRSFRSERDLTYGVGDTETTSDDAAGSEEPVGAAEPTV